MLLSQAEHHKLEYTRMETVEQTLTANRRAPTLSDGNVLSTRRAGTRNPSYPVRTNCSTNLPEYNPPYRLVMDRLIDGYHNEGDVDETNAN